jgi:tetratricopeptide (TPR) repeat protein
MRHKIYLILVVSFVFLITLAFFSPRFVYWPTVFIDQFPFPETNRAYSILKQLENPLVAISEYTNKIVERQILFPVIGYLLKLPPTVFLSIPFIGCFLALGCAARLFYEELDDKRLTPLLLMMFSSTSWFFVSTGWLAYFDSWYVLGLVLIAFQKSRLSICLCCLILPLGCSRFILGLPLALTVRALRLNYLERENLHDFVKDIVLSFVCILPALSSHLLSTFSNNASVSADGLRGFLTFQRFLEFRQECIEGAWHGLKLSWIGVVYFVYCYWSRNQIVKNAFVIFIMVLTLWIATSITGDPSRTMGLFSPALVAGLLCFAKNPHKHKKSLIIALVLLNFLLPAAHVVIIFEVPIFSVMTEIKNLQDPPQSVNPAKLCQKGQSFIIEGQFDSAMRIYQHAYKLDPHYFETNIGIAKVMALLGKARVAMIFYDRALKLLPPESKRFKDVIELKQQLKAKITGQ